MAEIGRWGGHSFQVSSNLIRGFTGLTIKGSSETEDKEKSGEKYVSRKSGKPIEISLTVVLNAMTGCDVRTEALQFVSEAEAGIKDYFYVGSKKLATCQLMLTDASVNDISIAGNGKWTSAKVQLTLKKCTKNDGTLGQSSSGSSGSKSSKSSGGSKSNSSSGSKKCSCKSCPCCTTSKSTSSSLLSTVVSAASSAASRASSVVKKGVSIVSSLISSAKSASANKK